jgi:hypothetical protein
VSLKKFNQRGIFLIFLVMHNVRMVTMLLTSLVMLEQYLLVEAKTLSLIFSSTKK